VSNINVCKLKLSDVRNITNVND